LTNCRSTCSRLPSELIAEDSISRTHLSLGKDSPEARLIEPREMGRVVALPQVGGLRHRYQRSAA
jgi:hypothetical protein